MVKSMVKMTEAEQELKYTFTPVKEKPNRAYRKGSKYDPILTAFLKGTDPLSSLSIEGKTANYLRTQLDKRITAKPKQFKSISVKVVNNVCYLEKDAPPEKVK